GRRPGDERLEVEEGARVDLAAYGRHAGAARELRLAARNAGLEGVRLAARLERGPVPRGLFLWVQPVRRRASAATAVSKTMAAARSNRASADGPECSSVRRPSIRIPHPHSM